MGSNPTPSAMNYDDDMKILGPLVNQKITEIPMMRVYAGSWLQYLKHGPLEAQEASMYALRSHGWTVWGKGYFEDFRWIVTFEGKEYVINPDVKDQKYWPDLDDSSFT